MKRDFGAATVGSWSGWGIWGGSLSLIGGVGVVLGNLEWYFFHLDESGVADGVPVENV